MQDTSTGLTWLALSLTNNTSYDDIFVNNYGNLLSLGFFAPTIGEVTTLFYDAGAPPGPITSNPEYTTSEFASAEAFISLFGCTAGCEGGSTDYYTEGYMISGDNGAQYAWAEIRNGTGGFGMSGIDQFSFDSEFGASHSQVGTGFYLVHYTSDIHGLFPGSPPQPKGIFAGTPGKANCHGQSVSALAQQYGGLAAAAAALGYSSVQVLQNAIATYCAG